MKRPRPVQLSGRKFLAPAALGLALFCAPVAGQRYIRPGPPDQGGLFNNEVIDYTFALSRVASAAEKLGETSPGKHPDVAPLLESIKTNADFLKVRWQEWFVLNRRKYRPPSKVRGDPYLRILKQEASLLKELKSQFDKGVNLREHKDLLADIELDLRQKADQCRNSEDALGRFVQVRVHTKSESGEATGYQVWCVPKLLRSNERDHERFPKLSTPTDPMPLPPGGYLFWVRKGDLVSEPVSQRIGGRGETEVDIDLRIP